MATKNFVLSRNADPKYLTADNKRELLGSIGAVSVAESTPTSMLNRTERLAITNGVVGATWAIQTDLPGIAWKLIAADATLDASWQGFPYTTNPDGSIAVTMELADVSNTVPDANVLGQVGGRPTIGDASTTDGRKLALLSDLSDVGFSGNSFIAVYGDGVDAVANGTALKAAYTAAKALTPNGDAKSATNRACVLVYPGRYDLVAATNTNSLTLDTEFVDLVGVGAREDIFITSVGNTVAQTANDVVIHGMTLESASGSTADATYYPNTNLPLTKMEDVNCVGNGSAKSHRTGVEFSGTFIDCTAGAGSFGNGGAASGTFTNCTAGNDSFGNGGAASGTFTDCTAGAGSFGNGGTASGTFTNCTAGNDSFGNEGTASGTFSNCTAGDLGFGGVGTASGTFSNCTAGEYGFGSFGTISGQLYGCRLTTGGFETVSGSGITRLCLDGLNVENNQG